jgi:hypothetical protein
MSDRDILEDDLNRLRRENRWIPLTHEEADAELAATADEPLDEAALDALVGSAISGEVLPSSLKPEDSRTAEEPLEHNKQALLFNRNPDDDTGELAERPEEPPPEEPQVGGKDDPERDPPTGVPHG